METRQTTTTIHYLRVPYGKGGDDYPEHLAEERLQKKLKDDGESILCRQCRQVVTGASERIAMEGSHQHTFVNPHGFVYQIGCFRSARGCGYTGPLTAEWSWFKGFSWRSAVCSSCPVHLGWLFASNAGEHFFGLILNRLLFGETDNYA